MMRRTSDGGWEFSVVEAALRSMAPPAISEERKAVLFDRIFSRLGAQERAAGDRLTAVFATRWVQVSAGAALAAAIVAAVKAVEATEAPESGGFVVSRPADAPVSIRGGALVNGLA